MKTLLSRMKAALRADTLLMAYTSSEAIQVVAPDTLPSVATSLIPFIGIAPMGTSESWLAQQKRAVHSVNLYVVQYMEYPEEAIMGDSVKRGLLEILEDVERIVRGNQFSSEGVNYLAKPTDIVGVSYARGEMGDGIYAIVAVIALTCERLFLP